MLNLPIRELCRQIRERRLSARTLAEHALAGQRDYASSGIFISVRDDVFAQAEALDRLGPPKDQCQRPLHGLPISIKDNFQVRGRRMTCGSSFYPRFAQPAKRDAMFVAKWRKLGAVIIGYTHLNEFAYGLTGENNTHGDLAQPLHPDRLTGGSSSGAAASVQAEVTCIGLGTDTGGSIRVPAALCGLVGMRLTYNPQLNRGLFPLARSFDTCGWLQKHLQDIPFILSALGVRNPAKQRLRIGLLVGKWLDVCEPSILDELAPLKEELGQLGFPVATEQADRFLGTSEIFSRLQASEAAKVHSTYLLNPECKYEPAVRDRLKMGAGLGLVQLRADHKRRRQLLADFDDLWSRFDLLLAPASPLLILPRGQNQSAVRPRLLQLTTPFSLAGLPVLTFPSIRATLGVGWQVAAAPHREDQLVRFAEILSSRSN